jgi:hypothetical protein
MRCSFASNFSALSALPFPKSTSGTLQVALRGTVEEG